MLYLPIHCSRGTKFLTSPPVAGILPGERKISPPPLDCESCPSQQAGKKDFAQEFEVRQKKLDVLLETSDPVREGPLKERTRPLLSASRIF